MKNNTKPHEEGFFLVELVLTTIILVASLLTIMTGVIRAEKLRRVDSEYKLAFVACRESIDELRLTEGTAIPGLNGAGFDVAGIDGSVASLRCVPGDPDQLPGQLEIVVDESNPWVTLYRVTATVNWIGVAGLQQLRIRTLLIERKRS